MLFLTLCTASFVYPQSAPQAFEAVKYPGDAGFSAERLKDLDQTMQQFVDRGLAPNVVTFIAHRGKVVSYKAFGYSHLETKTAVKKDDIFRLASQSKAIATVGLLTLFEKGKFLLDDPISKYIPAFSRPRVLVGYDSLKKEWITRPAKSEITIRQLMSHTAGIPYQHPMEELQAFRIPYFNSTRADVLSDVVNRLASRPLIADPGEKFVYGLNTDILGYLIEVLSGKKLDVFLRETILDPLGMKDTYFYLPDNKHSRLVELYSKANANDPLTVHSNEDYRFYPVKGAKTYFSAGAGLVGTIEDYAKFCQMLLNYGTFNNRSILGRKTVEMMFRNQIGDLEVWERKDKFGLGLQIITAESRFGSNTSPGSLTWGGMYCSEFTIDPTENLILIIFTNVQPYAHYSDLLGKFRVGVYQALE